MKNLLKVLLFLIFTGLFFSQGMSFFSCAGTEVKKDETPAVKERAEESFQKLEEEEEEHKSEEKGE